MRSGHTSLRKATRSGSVAVMVAVCLTILMAAVALAIDGGNLLDDQRQCQAAADAAALAAACQLYSNYATDQGKDPSSKAHDAALAVASANGFNNDGETNKVYVNIPPKYDQVPWKNMTNKPYKNLDGYAEVIIEYHQKRGFSKVMGSSDLIVRTRAVSHGAWVKPNAGVLVLDYQGGAALSARGNGSLTEAGGPVIVNSIASNAVFDVGNGTLTAKEFDITANETSLLTNPNVVTSPTANQIFLNQHPTPDPLAYLPAPGETNAPYSIPPTANVPTKGGKVSATAKNYLDLTQIPPKLYNNYFLLSPGSYGGPSQPQLPNFTNGDLVVFQQSSAGNNGIYYLNAGGFNANSADIRMDSTTSGGVMIYNAGTGTNDGINIGGNSSSNINLGPLTSGPYSGLVFWQARNATEDVQVAGNGTFDIQGTFYAAGAKLKTTGNGGTYTGANNQIILGSRIGSQYVSKDLEMAGNGGVTIDYNGPNIAKTRVLCLVE